MSNFGILLSTLDLSKIPSPELPPPADDGRIPVFSGKGYASQEVYPLSQEFIDYSSNIKLPVLDVGAAYGKTTISALKKGATVIVNELEQNSLDYIAHIPSITEDEKKRLYLKQGSILEVEFPKNSIGAIHLSRVMHFFHADDVELFFAKAYDWLVDKGRLYIITMSQYHYANPGEFYPEYNKKIKEGVSFPGDLDKFEFKGKVYNLNAIDPVVMMKMAMKYGFTCKKIELWGGEFDDNYTCAILIKDYHH